VLRGQGFDAEVFGAKPFFDEGICSEGFRAPGGDDKAVVDDYIGCEGCAETLLVLSMLIWVYNLCS